MAKEHVDHVIMDTKPPYYRIYLLTVWQEHNRSPPELITWRFRLEDPRSGQQRVFADAATLMSALREIAGASNAAQTQHGEEE
jgi:hypothetical protein